jgi:Transposase and inactivated derivatives
MRLKPQTYALTAVTHDRIRLFQRTTNAEILLSTLFRHREQNRYLLHGFVIMPDHLHVLLTPSESIEKSAQLIKGGFSFAIRHQYKGEIWQDGFHEHRVRDLEDFNNQLLYIINNPARKGFEGYPFVHTAFQDKLDPPSPHFSAVTGR